VAGGWARRRAVFSEVVAPVTDALVSLLDPTPGERILELAAGPGGVGWHVAPRVGPAGSVVVSDFAPEMVEAARAQAAGLNLGNVELAVVDAQAMPFADASFDGAVARFGYMLMPDPARGLAETRRVLRPGHGRVAFAIWGDRRANTWGTASVRALIELGHLAPPDPYGRGPFALDEPARLEAAVAAGGLAIERVDDVGVAWRLPSIQAWWDVMGDLSANLTEVTAQLDEAAVTELSDRAASHLDARATADGITIDGLARVILARPA
jgi:SAM-dependent methyltransferase